MAKNDNAKAPVLDLIGGTKKKKAAAPKNEAAPAPAKKPRRESRGRKLNRMDTPPGEF